MNKALQSVFPNPEVIINILARRSSEQRQQICKKFKSTYECSLEDIVRKKFLGHFREILLMLCKPFVYAAKCIQTMFEKRNLDIVYMMHIFRNYTPDEIREIKAVYEVEYGTSIQDDIGRLTEGFMASMLTSVLNADRPSLSEIDWHMALKDAKSLACYNDDNCVHVFKAINSRSYVQERAALRLYSKLSLSHMAMRTDDEVTDFLDSSLHDLQNLDFMLIHAVVSHCEVDMVQIKEYFERSTGCSLMEVIHENTQGCFRDTLLTLCGDKCPW